MLSAIASYSSTSVTHLDLVSSCSYLLNYHNSNYDIRFHNILILGSTVVIRTFYPPYPSLSIISIHIMSSSAYPPLTLLFSLSDTPRNKLLEWYEDVCAQARGLCAAFDIACWGPLPSSISL